MTNFERIKAMSVEEFAPSRIQYRDDWGDYVTDVDFYDENDYDKALKEEIEWLESEVTE